MIPEFMVISLLAGLGVAVVAGPLGSFVIWRRMAYFGDTLAHGALLGVAFGLFLQINIALAIILSSVMLAGLLSVLERKQSLASDTLLGILSHATLAAGLVFVSVFSDSRIDLFSFLFGDLLTSTWKDVALIAVIGSLVISALIYFWRSLILTTIDENMARIDGIATEKIKLALVVMIALVIAFAMKVVGVLLITALLIIPAAASRRLASSPEQMAIYASIAGMLSVVCGLIVSYFWDSPAGPSIVLAATALFTLSLLVPSK